MKNIIKLNDKIEIDLMKLIDSRLLVQANSGGGKSWLLRRLLEQSHGKVQQIIIDLEGEFSTLREKYDYILAGKGGDVVAESKTAALLARKILEMNVSAIVDLYELPHHERKHFVKLFLDSLINSPKEFWHPCLIIVDEAHQFCPEKGQSEAMEAVIDLATRGRKRGFCAVLATQRLSKLHKDAAAECNNKLIGRTGLDIDMKRATEELGFTSKDQYLSLRKLDPGEFFVYGPAISNEVIKAKVGEVLTTHPRAAGKGFKISKKIAPPTEKIKGILKKLTDLPQEAQKEMNTVADLKNEVSGLRRQLRIIGQNKTASPEIIKKTAQEAIIKRDKEWKVRIDEERKLWKGQVDKFYKVKRDLQNVVAIIGEPNYPEPHCPTYVIPSGKDTGKISDFGFPSLAGHPAEKVATEVIAKEMNGEDSEVKIQGGGLRMLKVLVSRYPTKLSKAQLGTFSRMKSRGGSFSTYLSVLRSAGFIVNDGNLLVATEAGIDYLGEQPNPPQTSEEVIELWKNNLTGGTKRMFDLLIEAYPSGYTKEALGEAAVVVHTGGSFSTYVSILRSNNLIEISNGEIKAAEHLFNL